MSAFVVGLIIGTCLATCGVAGLFWWFFRGAYQ